MESARVALLLLLASPAVLFTKDATAAKDLSSTPADKLQRLERLIQHQNQHQRQASSRQVLEDNVKFIHAELSQRWEEEKRVLEDNVKSIHAELKSERLQWLGQQQALDVFVKSLAAELKSEKQQWLGQTQTLEINAKSLQAEVQALSLTVHTLGNTLSGLTASGTTSKKHAAKDKENNTEKAYKQTQQSVEKRSDNIQTLDIPLKSTSLQQLEIKMDHELRALNTTVTHDVQQLRMQMTSCQTAVTSATHDLALMQNQLTAVKQTALVALREASHMQAIINESDGSSRASESQLQAVNKRIDSEVREMNQRLDGAAQTLQDELVLIVKVLNTKTDTEVTQLSSTLHSQAGALNHSVAMATQGVQAVGSQMQAVDSRVQAVEQAITRQDADIRRSRGSAYTRWGMGWCHERSQLVYKGRIAGGDKASGSMLCLPLKLTVTKLQEVPREHSQILGADYETPGALNQHEQLDCAVCLTSRSATITVPATTRCPDGWTREYSGFLMSGAPGKAPHDLVCVYKEPAGRPITGAGSESVPLYNTVIACGSLPCSKYPDGSVVTCAVCSK